MTYLVDRRPSPRAQVPLLLAQLVLFPRLGLARHSVDEQVNRVLFRGRDEAEVEDVVAGRHELDDLCRKRIL